MALKFGKASFEVIRGLTWGETITVLDDADNPVDLTGVDLEMEIREAIEDSVALMTLNSTNGRLAASTPLQGEAQINVSFADTEAEFPLNDYLRAKYVYDAIAIRDRGLPSEVREPIVAGKVAVSSKVTRPI